jgi:hypothetical protein
MSEPTNVAGPQFIRVQIVGQDEWSYVRSLALDPPLIVQQGKLPNGQPVVRLGYIDRTVVIHGSVDDFIAYWTPQKGLTPVYVAEPAPPAIALPSRQLELPFANDAA